LVLAVLVLLVTETMEMHQYLDLFLPLAVAAVAQALMDKWELQVRLAVQAAAVVGLTAVVLLLEVLVILLLFLLHRGTVVVTALMTEVLVAGALVALVTVAMEVPVALVVLELHHL
jgi:hypothetical protein